MAETLTQQHYFTWGRFVRTILVQFVAVGLLFAYWAYSSSDKRVSNLAVVAVVIWLGGAFAHRWSQLRSMERNGQLTSADFQANAFEYLRGSPSHWRLTIGGAVTVAFAVILAGMLAGTP